MSWGSAGRGAMRRAGVPLAIAAALALAPATPPPAQALPALPTSPESPGVAAEWIGAGNRVGADGPLALTLRSVSPRTPAPGGVLELALTLTNRSDRPLTGVQLRVQRDEALASAEDAPAALADPETTYTTVTSFGEQLDLDPGESLDTTLRANLAAPSPEGLGITGPGVYPVLVNANGRVDDGIVTQLAETRTLVPVRPGGDLADEANSTAGDRARMPRMTLLWPIAQRVPLVPGETGEAPEDPDLVLSDESLAQSMADGGRLDGLLGVLEGAVGAEGPAAEALRRSTCVAVEPELLVVADRMTHGYVVSAGRPSPVAETTRLRDSWGADDAPEGREGEGADEAAAWLGRLRELTRGMCVVAMPWGAADAGAVTATGSGQLTGMWLDDGQGAVDAILGHPGLPQLLLPPEGYLTANAVTAISAATDPDAPRTAVVAANTVGGIGAGIIGELAPGVRAIAAPTVLTTALAATGGHPETPGFAPLVGRHLLDTDSASARMQTAVGILHQELSDRGGDGEAGPIIAVPPAGWDPAPEEAAEWLAATGELYAAGEVTPLAPADIVGAPPSTAGTVIEPASDPGAVTATEVRRSSQQAAYITDLTEMMATDPAIALTPYRFTAPLMRDELRSMSSIGRRSRRLYDGAVVAARGIHDATGTMIQELRGSVRLLSPAGVYTRTTGASPIAVVGQNGLPLPVPARVIIDGRALAAPVVESVTLPAKGTVPLQLQPDIDTGEERRTTLTLALRAPAGEVISDPVEVVVRSGPSTGVLATVTIVALMAIAAIAVGVRRSRGPRRTGRTGRVIRSRRPDSAMMEE